MALITNEEILELKEKNPLDFEIYRKWATINKALLVFQNKASLKTFKYLYGKDAERLWNHFGKDCGHKYDHFLTYLTQEQQNELLYNTHQNNEMYYH